MSGILYNPETGAIGGAFRHGPIERSGQLWADYPIDDLPEDLSILSFDGSTISINQEAKLAALWKEARSYRDNLLKASDWATCSDVPLTEAEKSEILTYRQTLREIPQTFDDLNSIIWPEPPSVL